MRNILDIPEINAIASALLTALFAWIKRSLDIKKLKRDHAEEIETIRDTHLVQMDTLNNTILKLKKATDGNTI